MSKRYPRRARKERGGWMNEREREAFGREWEARGREGGFLVEPESSQDEPPPPVAPDDVDARLLAAWNALKPGDIVAPNGSAPQVVARKNRYSIRTEAGVNWSAGEMMGVRNDRMRTLINGQVKI